MIQVKTFSKNYIFLVFIESAFGIYGTTKNLKDEYHL